MSRRDKRGRDAGSAQPRLRGCIKFASACCLRRPYLFSRKRKDRGEKSAWTRLVPPASELRQVPMIQAAFHTILTLRASWYAPPDTGVSGLMLVALERLPSIEGALEIQIDVTFLRGPCRGGALLRPLLQISSEARAEQSLAPTTYNAKLCRKNVQSDKSRLHILFAANIQR